MRVLGIFYSLFAAGIILLYMVFAVFRLILGTSILRKSETEVLVKLGHQFGGLIMLLSRTKLKVEGADNFKSVPNGRRVFIVSNHESFLDIPCVLSVSPYPVGFVAKRELGRIPLLGFWIKKTGGVLYNRTDIRNAKKTLEAAVGEQESDRAILIFPEGTRNREGGVAPFKPGSIRLAIESDSIIIPVAMSGGRKKLEGNGWVVGKGCIRVRVLPPIDTRDWDSHLKGRFAEELRQLIVTNHQELS